MGEGIYDARFPGSAGCEGRVDLDAGQVEALYEGFTVDWDENGNIATNDAGNDIDYTFNWDNKLRKALWNESPEDSIEVKYNPFGNRVYKKSTASGSAAEHKYIVDITGKLPVILMDLNLTDSSLKKKYIYADSQVLAQHDIDDDAQPDPLDFKYFYLHDRLGSVRLVLADNGDVVKYYTYEPFGEVIDDDGTFDNAFRFTGQFFDAEIEEYYLRARQYNPAIARFTSRDPVLGKAKRPMTLHQYLYCRNDPVNRLDLTGMTDDFSALGQLRNQSIGSTIGIEAAGFSFAMRIIGTQFVNMLNMRATQLCMALDNGSIWVAARLSNAWGQVARYGYIAIAAVATWEKADRGGPGEVVGVIINDPHPVTTGSGVLAQGAKKAIQELWKEISEWPEGAED